MKRWLAPLTIFGLVGAAYLEGSLDWIEHGLADLRFRLSSRPASGSLVLVEIDSRSLRALDVWPWPRTHHAAVVDRLLGAGAKTIALDIDFSSRSTPQADAALADAIERAAGRIILPAFRQVVRDADGEPVFQQTWPQPIFTPNARVAAVNVVIEPDSRVRRYAIAELWDGVALPSLAAALAEASSSLRSVFTLDFGIRPETLPRLSYVDVMRGTFPPEAVRGKNVIVGAGAVELGDNLPVPIYKVLAGPVVQALAYEALVQGRALARISPIVALIVAGGIVLYLVPRFKRLSWRRGLIAASATSAAAAAVPVAVQLAAPISLDAAPSIVLPLLCYLVHLVREIDHQSLLHFIRRMEGMHRRTMMIRVVEDSFDGIVIADYVGKIQVCNASAARMLGRDAPSVIGQPVAEILPVALVADNVPTTGAEPRLAEVARPDGSSFLAEIHLSTSALALSKHQLERRKTPRTVYIYTFRDVTERQKAELERAQAMDLAVASNRAKTEFLANMSHELRTPLNAIIGFSEMMRMEAFGPIGSPRYKTYLTDIHGSAEHLLAVINDILDMSKIEAGAMTLLEADVSIPAVVASSLELIRERAYSGGVTVADEVPKDFPLLFADERMLKQMVLNLLSNSVKFTPQGGRLRVGAGIGADGRPFIAVADTGIGIAPEHIELVLTPFRQVDGSLQRKYEGTGLGLPLVKRMVELHGGELVLESALGAGTTVTLWFPAERIADLPATEPERRESAA
jgi:PAS domain S-box-containing protein